MENAIHSESQVRPIATFTQYRSYKKLIGTNVYCVFPHDSATIHEVLLSEVALVCVMIDGNIFEELEFGVCHKSSDEVHAVTKIFSTVSDARDYCRDNIRLIGFDQS